MTPVEELYHSTVAELTPDDRIRLAALILSDLPPVYTVDESDEWSDEDLADFSRAGWARAETALSDDRA